MTDKDREDAIPSDPKKLAEMVLHHIKLGDIRCYRCEMTAKKVIETHDYELSRIHAEAKAKALREAAERLCDKCKGILMSCPGKPNCIAHAAILADDPKKAV